MIKVGIMGARQEDAGELLRILIHHPETDIISLHAPAFAGRSVAACHHGFIGEEIVSFSDSIDPSALDVLFIAEDSEAADDIVQRAEEWPGLHIIDMSARRIHRLAAGGFEYGLSEINRKPLVRGARLAVVPTPAAALAMIALHPLALNQLIDSDLEISVAAPADMAASLDPGAIATEIATMIAKSQTGYSGKVHVRIIPSDMTRTMRVLTMMKSPLSIEEVDNLFETIYDDHNFVFTSLSQIDNSEVEGTQKCIVCFDKPGAGLLALETVGDSHMRGGAGDATHVMNLFFALDEKVGLTLKPSVFGRRSDSEQHTSWFA